MQRWQPARPLARRLLPQSPVAQKWSGNWMGVSGDKEAYEEWEAGERGDAKDGAGYVGTHAVSAVQMAEMDATQKRVWEVEQREERSSSTNTHNTRLHAHTHTYTLSGSTLTFSQMTVIHYWSFTDLLPECSPTVTPADLCQRVTVGWSQSIHCSQRLSAPQTVLGYHSPHCPLFHYPCLCSGETVLLFFIPQLIGLPVCW